MAINFNYTIRRYKRSDELQVYLIESESFGDHNPLDYLRFYEIFEDGFFVFEFKGIICGFIVGYPFSETEGHIFSLAVHKSYRNRGVATALLKHLLRHFFLSGITKVSLEVRVGNEGAKRLYEKNGFICLWTKEQYYSDGEDGYYMVADLAKLAISCNLLQDSNN